MTKEQLEARVKELLTALEQSAAQHNALAGRLAESQAMLKFMDDCAASANDDAVVEVVA